MEIFIGAVVLLGAVAFVAYRLAKRKDDKDGTGVAGGSSGNKVDKK